MDTEQQPERTATTQRTGQPELPPLRVVIWFRLIVGVVVCLTAAIVIVHTLPEALRSSGFSEKAMMNTGFVVLAAAALALVGVPSLAIALGLWRRQRRFARAAVVYDCLVVVPAVIGFVGRTVAVALMQAWGDTSGDLHCMMVVGGASLILAAEAIYLLRKVWGWRHAGRAFTLIAVGLVCVFIVPPLLTNVCLARHVRPLLSYIDSQWVRLPRGSGIFVQRWTSGRGTHIDFIRIETAQVDWIVEVEHRSTGRWRFPAGAEESAITGYTRSHPDLHSASDARDVLISSGVLDGALSSGHLVKTSYGGAAYAFWSPRSKGYYYVTGTGHLELHLKNPLEAP